MGKKRGAAIYADTRQGLCLIQIIVRIFIRILIRGSAAISCDRPESAFSWLAASLLGSAARGGRPESGKGVQ